jgi:outer membrane protein assembly factor BamB
VSNESNLPERVPKNGFSMAWKVPVGPGYSGPIIVGNKVIVAFQRDGKEILQARDRENSAVLWSVDYPTDFSGGMFGELGPRATPCASSDVVVSLGAESVLQCVELANGNVKWRRQLSKEMSIPDSFFGAACSPIIEQGLVLVNLGAKDGAGIVAFRLKDGSLAWKSTDEEASYSSPIVADLGGKRTALFFARSGLHGLDPQTGASRFYFRWRARIDASVNAATPLVRGQQIFISSSYNTGAVLLDVDQGELKPIWKSNETLTCHYNTCVESNGFLFGIDGRQEGGARLQCVEWTTGNVKWTEERFGCATLTLAGSHLWIVKEDGTLVLAKASPEAFTPLGSQRILDGPVRAHPALAYGCLYVRNNQHLVGIKLVDAP